MLEYILLLIPWKPVRTFVLFLRYMFELFAQIFFTYVLLCAFLNEFNYINMWFTLPMRIMIDWAEDMCDLFDARLRFLYITIFHEQFHVMKRKCNDGSPKLIQFLKFVYFSLSLFVIRPEYTKFLAYLLIFIFIFVLILLIVMLGALFDNWKIWRDLYYIFIPYSSGDKYFAIIILTLFWAVIIKHIFFP